jgi:hypothetical protein
MKEKGVGVMKDKDQIQACLLQVDKARDIMKTNI